MLVEDVVAAQPPGQFCWWCCSVSEWARGVYSVTQCQAAAVRELPGSCYLSPQGVLLSETLSLDINVKMQAKKDPPFSKALFISVLLNMILCIINMTCIMLIIASLQQFSFGKLMEQTYLQFI